MPAPTCVLLDLDREFDSPATAPPLGSFQPDGPDVRLEHRAVLVWTERYAFGTRWLLPDVEPGGEAAAAVDLIACSSFFAAGKVYRALVGLAHQPWLDPRDARDSAAVAVLALDRSHQAWLALIEAGLVDGPAVTELLTDLVQVRDAVVAAFPEAGRRTESRLTLP
jgi:hypothetical protein